MATIGFENISVSVQEGAGFAVLYVAVLSDTTLGGDVTVRFSTAGLSATGELCYCIVGFVKCCSIVRNLFQPGKVFYLCMVKITLTQS